MGEGTPARIDRAALERIIQRAAELQTAERDIGEELTPDEVLALGREVGIPGRYLQQAMLEERTRVGAAAPGGLRGSGSPGPAQVTAQRAVPGDRGRRRGGADPTGWRRRSCSASSGSSRAGSPGSRSAAWPPPLRRSTAAFSRGSAAMMLARADTVSATIAARSRPAGAT